METGEFAKVIFHLTKDTFPPNANLECPFEITPNLEASKWDWVGIFPVGWKSTKEYLTYQYVPLGSYQINTTAFRKITFEASILPQDISFYQICYISYATTGVCGASEAIQFLSTEGKMYVEEECEGIVVVREKTDVLEEAIEALSHRLEVANKDREATQQEVFRQKEKLELRERLIIKLREEVRKLKDLYKEETDKTEMCARELKKCSAQLLAVEAENTEVEEALRAETKKAAELDSRFTALRGEMRALQSEKDEMCGQNQSLVDELDSYKTQVTESQTQLTQAGKTIARLNSSLEQAYNECSTVVEECETLKKKVAQQEEELHKFQDQVAQLTQGKVDVETKLGDLVQEVQNANDMLAACDTMKQKLSSDLEAYEQTQQKMSSKFENQESEVRSLQAQVEQKTLECAELRSNVHHMEVELAHKAREVKCAELNLNRTLSNVQETTNHTQTLLKEVARLEKKHGEARQQLETTMAQLKVANSEKTTLKEQLREFEERLTESLAVRDTEVSNMQMEMQKQQKQMDERNKELVLENQMIKGLKEKVAQLHGNVRGLEEEVNEKQIQVEDMERCGKEQERHCRQLETEAANAKQEKDLALQKLGEVLATEQQKDEAASQFCLWKANQTLTERLLAKDRDIAGLKRSMSDEQRRRQQREEEVKDLKQRLELGRLEYQEKAHEYQQLLQEMKVLVELDHNTHARTAPRCTAAIMERSPSRDAPLTSDTEAGEGTASPAVAECEHEVKYRALKKEHKKVKRALVEKGLEMEERLHRTESQRRELTATIVNLKSDLRWKDVIIQDLEDRSKRAEMKPGSGSGRKTDVTDYSNSEDDREEEEEETCLMYGNPYSALLVHPPTLQTIIRSTLEEEADSVEGEGSEGEEDPLYTAAGEEGSQLPPPLEPEVLPLQGAVPSADHVDEAAGEEGGQEVFEDCDPVADDRFLDAIGEGMKICPFCQTSISGDFEEHVATHFGRICPVCRSQADDTMSPEDFEQHVNKCLDKGAPTHTAAAQQAGPQ